MVSAAASKYTVLLQHLFGVIKIIQLVPLIDHVPTESRGLAPNEAFRKERTTLKIQPPSFPSRRRSYCHTGYILNETFLQYAEYPLIITVQIQHIVPLQFSFSAIFLQ